MKINFFCVIFLITISLTGQNKFIDFEGFIHDESTNQPISDVLIIQNNGLIGFSDKDGRFNLRVDISISNSVTLKHFSYKQITHKINESKNNKIILSPLVNVLDEVLIGFDNEAEDIISKVHKKFKNTYRKDPYWASSNLKQVVTLNDSLPGYIEGNYNIFMVGDDKDVWNLPILIPLETKRTKEKFTEAFGTKEQKKQTKFYNNLGLNLISDGFLTSYRFFEFAHPLLRKGKRNYSFSLDDTIIIDGIEHYVISYKSLKEVNNIKGRKFRDMRGEIVLEKKSLTLKSISSLHRRSTYKNSPGVDNIFTINYQTIDGLVYVKTISYNIKNKTSNIALNIEGIININKVNTKPVENYRRTISPNRYLFHSSDIYNSYNSNLWLNNVSKPNFLELKYFGGKIKNEAFIRGANQKINPKELYPGTKESENKLLELMPKSTK